MNSGRQFWNMKYVLLQGRLRHCNSIVYGEAKIVSFRKIQLLFLTNQYQQSLNNEITNVLPIHCHLTITDFNAWTFFCYTDVIISMVFMRSLDWFETLVSVGNFVQISFRFWAGEAIWETAVRTWTRLFNIIYNPCRDRDKISAYRLSRYLRWEDQTKVFWAQDSF